eukprot:31330-Pelagococcus_subviridis.AAC.2
MLSPGVNFEPRRIVAGVGVARVVVVASGATPPPSFATPNDEIAGDATVPTIAPATKRIVAPRSAGCVAARRGSNDDAADDHHHRDDDDDDDDARRRRRARAPREASPPAPPSPTAVDAAAAADPPPK